MLFNSIEFLIFLPLVFVVYWLLGKYRTMQNLLVLIASYVFYGWWDVKFLILIVFTSLWSYFAGLIELSRHPFDFDSPTGKSAHHGSRILLAITLVVNLGILAYFKYCNFFLDSFYGLLSFIGVRPVSRFTLNIILPVGISFYTFQAMSYSIDVYRRTIRPTKDVIAYLAFISFFPQLVAGPIERATNLLPQFLRPRTFDYALAVEGCRQMLWGFLKKIVLADSCAYAANAILNNQHASSISLWVGMFLFTFQIYGDFSGYSDIAIGCSKLFGVRLMRNFETPYFSRDIAEFWRRWHISLTTWFRDYLYIPLGGSRCGQWKKVRNTFVIFLVSGFWHGANWTFIAWGAFHACCFMPLLLSGRNRKYVKVAESTGLGVSSIREIISVLVTFVLVVVGWTFFRAPNISTAGFWLCKMLTFSDLTLTQCNIGWAKYAIIPIVGLIGLEWFNHDRDYPKLPQKRFLRWCVYYPEFPRSITIDAV